MAGSWLCPLCKTKTRQAHDGPRECLRETMAERDFYRHMLESEAKHAKFWMHMFDVAVGKVDKVEPQIAEVAGGEGKDE